MRRTLLFAALVLLTLVGVMLFNASRNPALPMSVSRYAPALDREALAARLGEAISIPTISTEADAPPLQALAQLRSLLEVRFVRTHATLSREIVNEAALLYRWQGRERCAPMLLLAHQDVVPVEPGTEAGWTHPPFSGAVADGYIWGRGAIDDKAALMGMMEAVEHLVTEGFTPRCDVYFAFGHDEEVGGADGARALAARLQQLGVKPAFVLDEGGALTEGTIPKLEVPIATIGVAEKGYLSVQLQVSAGGGHSSMPPRHTAIGRLAGAVARLEARRPAARISPVQAELLRRIAPHLGLVDRIVLSNLWLTAPLVERMFAANPTTDATLRTTTAPTVFRAGLKDNVLPQQAEAVVNFRIQPGDSIAAVMRHVEAVVNDPEVRIGVKDGFSSEPTEPSAWDDPAFLAIERALRAVSSEPVLVVAPYVTSGATDARHYAQLTPRLYRFTPFKLDPDGLASFHGSNERLALDEYVRAVSFYMALLRDADDAR